MKICVYQLHFGLSESDFEVYDREGQVSDDVLHRALIARINKEFDVDGQAVPHKGDFIDDSYWPRDCEGGFEVVNVCFNYSNNVCEVTLKPFIVPKKYFDSLKEIANAHHWDVSFMK